MTSKYNGFGLYATILSDLAYEEVRLKGRDQDMRDCGILIDGQSKTLMSIDFNNDLWTLTDQASDALGTDSASVACDLDDGFVVLAPDQESDTGRTWTIETPSGPQTMNGIALIGHLTFGKQMDLDKANELITFTE